ncbi:iron-containing redox enzyme family protein [Streptomyces sp. R39]|uniref:Iron-containing redox enzyme family protein n=1 Tax=Streptomyces sp. R39 TaxID=3238631 RepID=A0AB39QWH4_9ACTN|nr:iron-containing redox enzyme family protein [Streptomyces shenzhenensis]
MTYIGPWHAESALRLVDSNVDAWDYESRFVPVETSTLHPVVELASRLVPDSGIEDHPFFRVAAGSRKALEFWVTQELFVTGVFAQLLNLTASAVVNVHQRARLNLVIQGEHGGVRKGAARASHPWLLHRLRESMGIPQEAVTVAAPTHTFLRALAGFMDTPVNALGGLGVGNEQMLVPEYGAVKQAFESAAPDADYAEFLHANIDEDTAHSAIMAHIASELITRDPSLADGYLAAARGSVIARKEYYDELYEILA